MINKIAENAKNPAFNDLTISVFGILKHGAEVLLWPGLDFIFVLNFILPYLNGFYYYEIIVNSF